jgi:hypothetical protein
LSIEDEGLTAAGAEDAEDAQRIEYYNSLRLLCELCACGGELAALYEQE